MGDPPLPLFHHLDHRDELSAQVIERDARGVVGLFFQAEDGIRDWSVTGVQTCALPIWLQTWQANQTINTFNVPARPNINTQIIQPWLAASGGASLDLGIAPFRLLAIVNRLDLRTGSGGYGGSTRNAGELRVVFGAGRPGRSCAL